MVVFDGFRKPSFETRIRDSIISESNNVLDVVPVNPELLPGIKFADKICSVIRSHMSGSDENKNYSLIEKNVIFIDF